LIALTLAFAVGAAVGFGAFPGTPATGPGAKTAPSTPAGDAGGNRRCRATLGHLAVAAGRLGDFGRHFIEVGLAAFGAAFPICNRAALAQITGGQAVPDDLEG
jgi:hypothetical protein